MLLIGLCGWLSGAFDGLMHRAGRDVSQATVQLGDYYRGLRIGQSWSPEELRRRGLVWTEQEVAGKRVYEIVNPPGVSKVLLSLDPGTRTVASLVYQPD